MEATVDGGRWSAYVWAKLASLLAFAPLGVWTFFHVLNNLVAFRGARPWQASVTASESPATLAITTVVVLAPLTLQTISGVARLFTARPNNARYGYFENLTYLLQRLSAIGVVGFVGAHLWLAFLRPRFVEGHAETFRDLAAHMHHHLPTLVVYLLGTLAVAFHLGNGISGFAWNWGLVASRKAVIRVQLAGILFFVVMLLMSWSAIYALWAAGERFPFVE